MSEKIMMLSGNDALSALKISSGKLLTKSFNESGYSENSLMYHCHAPRKHIQAILRSDYGMIPFATLLDYAHCLKVHINLTACLSRFPEWDNDRFN